MNQELTGKELFDFFRENGEFEVRVVNSDNILDETYAENGMIGVVKSVKIIQRAEEPDDEFGDMYQVDVDWLKYSDMNEPLESRDWFVRNDEGEETLGTMKEAGVFPEDGIEDIPVMENEHSGFEIYIEDESRKKLYDEWVASGKEKSYIKWLEDRVLSLS